MHGDSISSQRHMSEGSYSPVYFRRNHALPGNVELSGSDSFHLVEQVSSDELGAEDSEIKDIDKEILPDATEAVRKQYRFCGRHLKKSSLLEPLFVLSWKRREMHCNCY